MTPAWPLRLLRWAYVAFIAAASGVALAHGLQGSGESRHSAVFVVVLAGAELAGALAFLIEPVEIAAAALLVAVYVVAAFVSATSADYLALPRFTYFAATAVAIVVVRRRRFGPTPTPA